MNAKHLGDQRFFAIAGAHGGQPLGEHALMAEQVAERIVQQLDLGLVEATPLQADDIEPGQPGAVADHAAERDHVRLDPGYATDHGRAADPDILMDRRRSADHRMVGDRDMAAHHDIVGDDHVIAHGAVMRDMGHRHQQAVGAHPGDPLAGHRAAMDRAVLAHLGARADLAARRLAGIFQVLRREADGAERIQHHVRADPRVPVHDHMRHQLDAVIDRHVRADRAEGPDPDPHTQLGAACDHGGGMDDSTGRPQRNRVGHGIHSGASR